MTADELHNRAKELLKNDPHVTYADCGITRDQFWVLSKLKHRTLNEEILRSVVANLEQRLG